MGKQNDIAWNAEKGARILKELRQAEQILVGVGAGFPLAAGVEPLPLQQKLTEKEYWPFWLPYIQQQRLNKAVPMLYQQLAQLLQGKDYFVIDSNPDGFLQYSGLELARIYKAQGDMARVQCSQNCQKHTWIGKQYFERVQADNNYLPKCPHCGAPLIMNVYVDKHFCDMPYREKNEAYFRFINGSAHNRLIILELGVGYTMPELMRFPFEQIVMNHKHAKLIRINTQHPLCVEENRHKAICVGADLAQVLPDLLAQRG
jgi:NAD-dependent SIR2 family protein deacetylase